MRHGFYSEKAANYYGTSIYRKHNNPADTVMITAVYPTKEQGETDYKWDDKIYVGEVSDWVGSHLGKESRLPEFNKIYEIQKSTRDSRIF